MPDRDDQSNQRDLASDADADVVAGQQPPSARTPLDRARIVAAALSYIDEFGLTSLSMRRLGAVLGVEAMSLYRYVPGRENLLDAVVEALLEEMRADDDVFDTPRYGWQDFLQRLAHGIRRVAISHPRAFPLVVARPPEAPWLRPPLRSMHWVEIFLTGLADEGFSDQAAVSAYRAYTSFLLGHLLLEVTTLGADVGPLDAINDAEPRNDKAGPHPAVDRLSSQLAEDHSAEEFEESLENVLNRIAQTQTES